MNTSFFAQAEVYITQAFPNITFEQMHNWNMNEFMKNLARAEWALTTLRGVPPLFTLKEEEEPQEAPPEETLKEMGDRIRQDGLDPMTELSHLFKKPSKIAPFPFIGGTKLLRNEEALRHVRKQISEPSE